MIRSEYGTINDNFDQLSKIIKRQHNIGLLHLLFHIWCKKNTLTLKLGAFYDVLSFATTIFFFFTT